MKLFNHAAITTLMATLMLGLSGCNGEATTSQTDENSSTQTETDEHAGHDHPSHGPHGGDLIELGGEDYHAEIVHTDNDEIVIYILSSDAKTAVPIDASEITINAVHDGTPEQFTLSAVADEGDPEGKSSRFSSTDEELLGHMHEADADAKLVVSIDGKQHSGKIAHDHDHDHGHSHE